MFSHGAIWKLLGFNSPAKPGQFAQHPLRPMCKQTQQCCLCLHHVLCSQWLKSPPPTLVLVIRIGSAYPTAINW
eukprot:5775461-Amphidinium_carterae.1